MLVAFFNEFETLSPEIQRSLLPSKETVKGRKVVVFRVLQSGASMRHYLPLLVEVLKRENVASEVEGYFISPPEVKAEGGFFPDWGQDRKSLPKVTLVRDGEYANWLNLRDLFDPTASIHGETYFKHIPLDEIEAPAKFEVNEASEHLDRRISFLEFRCSTPFKTIGSSISK